jgi:hypothetical protein
MTSMPTSPRSHWTLPWRAVVFVLAATSIWCLLAEMYGLCSMRSFTFAILIPATALLYGLAAWDRSRGDGALLRAVVIGSAAGFVAAVAYDVFRLPFVFSHAWGLDALGVPQMPLFKVFPRFGALILGEPYTPTQPDGQFTLASHVIGWLYHFSNGVTFGVMYVALLGQPRTRTAWWGVALAVGIEAALLISPYSRFFAIQMSALFVAVTLTAHLIFGWVMGAWARWQANRAAPAPASPV